MRWRRPEVGRHQPAVTPKAHGTSEFFPAVKHPRVPPEEAPASQSRGSHADVERLGMDLSTFSLCAKQ